ncbi:hypothetical protein GCM10017744_104970 [Streptomyces antimycoticus]
MSLEPGCHTNPHRHAARCAAQAAGSSGRVAIDNHRIEGGQPPWLSSLRVRRRGPVRVVDSISGSESRVVPAMTLKSTEAWPVLAGGSGARPWGAVRLRYLRMSNFDARIFGLPFCG